MKRVRLIKNGLALSRLLVYYARIIPDWRRWYRKRAVPAVQTSKGRHALHIAFVACRPRIREIKLAYAARRCGHRITLISTQMPPADRSAACFDTYHAADNPWQILSILETLKPDVIHLFALYDNARLLPVVRYAARPVVYDPYDCSRGMIKRAYQHDRMELFAERFIFSKAAHICARSLEPLYLRRVFNYRMPSATFFPDYCWSVPSPPSAKARDPHDEEIHVVYCGGVWPEDRFSQAEFGYAQYLEIGRALAEQRVHLHIYPSFVPQGMAFEAFYAVYLEASRSNRYLHIYPPVNHDELMRRLRGYDAGLHIFGTGVTSHLGRMTRAKIDYSTANKLFDYLEVGLPVVMHKGFCQYGLMRHYGVAVGIDHIRELRGALEAYWRRRRKHAVSAGTASLDAQASRLSRMYQSILSSRAR